MHFVHIYKLHYTAPHYTIYYITLYHIVTLQYHIPHHTTSQRYRWSCERFSFVSIKKVCLCTYTMCIIHICICTCECMYVCTCEYMYTYRYRQSSTCLRCCVVYYSVVQGIIEYVLWYIVEWCGIVYYSVIADAYMNEVFRVVVSHDVCARAGEQPGKESYTILHHTTLHYITQIQMKLREVLL